MSSSFFETSNSFVNRTNPPSTQPLRIPMPPPMPPTPYFVNPDPANPNGISIGTSRNYERTKRSGGRKISKSQRNKRSKKNKRTLNKKQLRRTNKHSRK